jgi:predicted Zn-dependent peptidase
LLAANYGSFGDWRKLFTQLDDLNKVTAEDVERVAHSCFAAQHRTVAFTVVPSSLGRAGESRP